MLDLILCVTTLPGSLSEITGDRGSAIALLDLSIAAICVASLHAATGKAMLVCGNVYDPCWMATASLSFMLSMLMHLSCRLCIVLSLL